MKKMTIVVIFITVIAKVFGFLRETILASFFGVSAITDAFNVASTIPSSVLAIVAAALVTGIIPMITRISSDGEERVNYFTSNVLNIFLLFCGALMLIILAVPEIVISIFAANLKPEALIYAVAFLRVISFGIFSVAFVQLGSGYLNVKRSFIVPASITIISNVIIILTIILASSVDKPMLLAYGQLVAMIVQTIVMVVFMYRAGFKYQAVVDFNDKDLRVMIRLALPLLISAVLSQANDIIMKNVATVIYDGEGAFTYMSLATRLTAFVSGIFITAILNVTYPTITENVVQGNIKKINKSINESILMISVFVVPALVGFIALARGIVEIVYLRGLVTPADIDVIVPIFIFDALVLIALSVRELFFRIHYAYHDMKSPVKISVMVTAMFIAGLFIFPPLFGNFGHPLAGIAFAYSFAAILGCYPNYLSVKRLVGRLNLKAVVKDLSKIIISAALMGVVLILIKGPLGGIVGGTLGTLISITVGALVYLVAIIGLKTNFVLQLIYPVLFK